MDTQEKARRLMIRQHKAQMNRQQSMLERVSNEIDLKNLK